MQSINFIDPVPPQKQRALIIWLYSSVVGVLVLLSTMFYIHIQHMRIAHRIAHNVNDLKQHTSQFDTLVKTKQQLENNKKQLDVRLQKLQALHQSSQAPYLLLLELASITPADTICLTNCDAIPGKSVHLEGLAHTVKGVTSFIDDLQKSHLFKDVSLASLITAENNKESIIRFALDCVWNDEHEDVSGLSTL